MMTKAQRKKSQRAIERMKKAEEGKLVKRRAERVPKSQKEKSGHGFIERSCKNVATKKTKEESINQEDSK